VAGEGRRRILSEAAVGIGGAFLGRSGIGAELFLITRKVRAFSTSQLIDDHTSERSKGA
jgi:hypothetical protein